MIKLLKKILVPHESNNFHPHATRHYSLLVYAIVFLAANYVVFPMLGVSRTRVQAATIDTDELISLANKERKSLGLNTLRKDSRLANAALAKGNDMLKKQYWSHFGPNGETPWQFITGAGYNYVYAGENLAKDFQTSLDTHLAWMNSKTHRENIVNTNFKDVGIAVVSGEFKGYNSIIVVEMFGSEEAPAQPQPTQQSKNPISTPKPTQTNGGTTATPVPAEPTPEPINPPTINKPLDGSLFNDVNVHFEGVATSGDTIKVFSNNQQIGELPKENAAFTFNLKLQESKNNIYMKSKDSASGRESAESNHVTIDVDTVKPDLEKIKVQIFKQYKNVYVAVASEEPLARVEYTHNGKTGDFFKQDNNFELKLTADDLSKPEITVRFYDIAGNFSEKTFNLTDETLTTTTPPVILSSSSSGPFKLGGALSNIFNLSTSQKFNALFILAITIIMIVDASFLLKRGLKRDYGSYHSFNIVVMIIAIVGIFSLV